MVRGWISEPGDGLVGNNTLTIYAPYHQPVDPPYYALLINCWLYHDWYAVQYRYKWMEGDAPSNYEPPKILIDSLDQALCLLPIGAIQSDPSF